MCGTDNWLSDLLYYNQKTAELEDWARVHSFGTIQIMTNVPRSLRYCALKKPYNVIQSRFKGSFDAPWFKWSSFIDPKRIVHTARSTDLWLRHEGLLTWTTICVAWLGLWRHSLAITATPSWMRIGTWPLSCLRSTTTSHSTLAPVLPGWPTTINYKINILHILNKTWENFKELFFYIEVNILLLFTEFEKNNCFSTCTV